MTAILTTTSYPAQGGRRRVRTMPKTVAEFLLTESENAAPATVSRRGAAIAKIHKLLKLDNPARTEEVSCALEPLIHLLAGCLRDQRNNGHCICDDRGLRTCGTAVCEASKWMPFMAESTNTR